ncbi:MAG: hypothetical protein HC921_17990 [Synechococcaceae cyanobacterium SM2_3_1]|nr:hypothetical protein [Synechococcaceae cyanobacterium SM2_3_1]
MRIWPGRRLLKTILILLTALLVTMVPAWAELGDDHYDGNIFALYGSNGGMIPPKVNLEGSLKQQIPALVVYYIDDSRDCKQYAAVIANLQVRYGLGVNFIPYAVDSLDLEDSEGAAAHYQGKVPKTLLYDREGQISYEAVGSRSMVEVENQIRSLFNLDPIASDSLQPKLINEVQTGFKNTQPRS